MQPVEGSDSEADEEVEKEEMKCIYSATVSCIMPSISVPEGVVASLFPGTCGGQ